MARSAGCALFALAAPRSMTGVVPPRSGEGRYLLGCTTGAFILPSVQVQAAKPQVRGWRAHAAGRSETCRRCARRSPGRRGIVMWALGSAPRRVDRFPPAALVTRAGSDDNDVVGVAD